MNATWTNYRERAEKARLLFEDVLKFEDVRMFLDIRKTEIIDIFKKLKARARNFEVSRG